MSPEQLKIVEPMLNEIATMEADQNNLSLKTQIKDLKWLVRMILALTATRPSQAMTVMDHGGPAIERKNAA